MSCPPLPTAIFNFLVWASQLRRNKTRGFPDCISLITQASKFDPEGDYIRRWLPELRHVNTKDLLSGEITPMERRGYPAPIVSHKKQQAHFKALYASLPKA